VVFEEADSLYQIPPKITKTTNTKDAREITKHEAATAWASGLKG